MTLPVPNLDDRTFLDLVREARARIAAVLPGVDRPVGARPRHGAGRGVRPPDRGHALPAEPVAGEGLRPVPEPARGGPAPAVGGLDRPRVQPESGNAGRRGDPDPGRHPGRRRGGPAPVVHRHRRPRPCRPAPPRSASPRTTASWSRRSCSAPAPARPGQVLRARRAPLVTTTEPLRPAARRGGRAGRAPCGRRRPRVRRTHVRDLARLDTFAGAGPADRVYLPSTGVAFGNGSTFGRPGRPVADVAAVPAGREIRLWYRTGGGPAGNVAAGTLTACATRSPG